MRVKSMVSNVNTMERCKQKQANPIIKEPPVAPNRRLSVKKGTYHTSLQDILKHRFNSLSISCYSICINDPLHFLERIAMHPADMGITEMHLHSTLLK